MTNRPHPLDQVEIRFGIAGGLVVLVLCAVRLAGLDDGYAFGLLLVTTVALSAAVNRRLAVLLGLSTWALCTGFLTNTYGVLTFSPRDLALMGELVATSLLISHLAAVAHAVRAADHDGADRRRHPQARAHAHGRSA